MDTSGQAGTSGGGGGAKNQTTSSRRNQNSTNGGGQLHEKIHQMIYGYLIRNGLTSAAESLRLESRHLPQSLQHPFMILNDSMHDHNLEEIIQVFHRDGHFGISQNMVAFGIELRNITKKFIELVPQCVDSNSLHQQLYGQSVYSRQQAQHNYNLRPAPQAYAQMKQKEQNLQAEISFLRQQIPTVAVAPPPVPQPHQQQQVPPPQAQCAPPPPPPLQPIQMEIEQEDSSELPRSSRRKPTHPQNRNQAVENAFVGYINERAAEMPIDSLLDEPFGLDFTLRPEFLMSYDPMHDDVNNDPLLHPLHQEGSQEDQQRFDEVFETVLTETEQRAHLDEGSSLVVVEEEIVVETASQDYGSHGRGGVRVGAQVQYPPPPPSRDAVDRLLSPIIRHQTDFQSPSQSASHHSGLNVSSSRLSPPQLSSRPPQNDVMLKKEIPSTSEERRVKRDGEKKDRKYDERSERSARNSISPARSRTSDESRRRDRDRRHRDVEKEKDRQETDRESTSSAASTTTTTVTSESKKETETERRRRKEKEREERLRANTSSSSSSRSKSRNLNQNPEHAANLLTTIKTAGGMTSSEKNHGSSKRKAEGTMAPLTTYKIPKRAPNSTPSHDQSFGRGELPTSTTTTRGDRGVERAERSGSKKPSPTATISEGFDVEDNTRFILPMGHAARLSSILLNCDAMYQEYQNRLHGKENNGKENTSSTTTPVVPPSSILPSTSSTSTTQPPPPPVRPHHPKGHQYAPMKGSSMSMEGATEKEKPTSSASSSSGSSSSGSSISDASDSSEDDDEEAPPPTSSSTSSKPRKHQKTRRSESPEEKNKLKKLINQKHADKLLDRLHGK